MGSRIRTYHVSYIQRKEAEGQIVKKFFKKGEPVLQTLGKNNEGTSESREQPEEELAPTQRVWRLYIERYPSKGESRVGMILDMHVFVESRLMVNKVEGSRVSRTGRPKDTGKKSWMPRLLSIDHLKDKSSLDASAKLTRVKLNKRSRDADLSKDKSGPESPPEFWRSWCVKGNVRSRVIISILAQQYLRTIRQRQTRSTIKSQKTPSKNKELTYLRMSRRLEDQSTTTKNERRERSKSRRKMSEHQETSSDFEYKEGSNDACEDMNSPYKRPKPTPFTQRITRFKYNKRAKLHRNIRGVPPVLCFSAFMHGLGHPKLAKKLNDKIPKTMDEMCERFRAFIRGEVAAGSAEMARPSQRDKGYVCSACTRGPKRAKNRGDPREA
nr:reverse transcriptase domain-containing protein [Tanacetum cinerariifolium]